MLPAATEIVGALGLMDQLVAVAHECDYPEEAKRRPRVTHCEIHGKGLPAEEIDRWVSEPVAGRPGWAGVRRGRVGIFLPAGPAARRHAGDTCLGLSPPRLPRCFAGRLPPSGLRIGFRRRGMSGPELAHLCRLGACLTLQNGGHF